MMKSGGCFRSANVPPSMLLSSALPSLLHYLSRRLFSIPIPSRFSIRFPFCWVLPFVSVLSRFPPLFSSSDRSWLARLAAADFVVKFSRRSLPGFCLTCAYLSFRRLFMSRPRPLPFIPSLHCLPISIDAFAFLQIICSQHSDWFCKISLLCPRFSALIPLLIM